MQRFHLSGLTFFLMLLLVFGCVAEARALQDMTIPQDAASVDLNCLSKLADRDVPALAEKLNACPQLQACDMQSVRISLSSAAMLAESCPQIAFHFILEVENKKIDSLEETLDLDGMHLSRKLKLVNLRRMLTCMPRLESVLMVNARFQLTDMEALLADFPEIDFQWTVRSNGMTFLPGATAYSTLKGRQEPRYTAEDLAPVIRWCPELLALDVGHNNVSDLSFLSAWPHLRRLIVVDSRVPVTDISPLAELEELEYVELFMQQITDISPLAGKTSLLDLNLCHNDITDLTPLYSCVNLERLWITVNPHLSEEEIENLKAALPNCTVETEAWQSTGAGWREHPRYETMYTSFIDGVYLPFE